MNKTAIIALLVGTALSTRVPMKHHPVNPVAMQEYIENLQKLWYTDSANGAIPLKDFQNVQYTVEVDIGTPPQKFTMIPDTGSSNVWVYSGSCHNKICNTHKTYKSGESSTYTADGEDFSVSYGSGSIQGFVSHDVVTMGGINSKMGFGEISSVSGQAFYQSSMDGIIGLAYDVLSTDSLPTWLDNAPIKKSFSFYLGGLNEDSYMVFPGYEADKFPNMQVHDVKQEAWWVVNFTGFGKTGDVKAVSGYTAIVDSGTSLIVGPYSVLGDITDNVKVAQDCSNVDSLPSISFRIDNTDYEIKGSDYAVEVAPGQCVLGIQSVPFMEQLILGDVFMRRYYVFFDMVNNQVGFQKH